MLIEIQICIIQISKSQHFANRVKKPIPAKNLCVRTSHGRRCWVRLHLTRGDRITIIAFYDPLDERAPEFLYFFISHFLQKKRLSQNFAKLTLYRQMNWELDNVAPPTVVTLCKIKNITIHMNSDGERFK
jgi:hypothetical protein